MKNLTVPFFVNLRFIVSNSISKLQTEEVEDRENDLQTPFYALQSIYAKELNIVEKCLFILPQWSGD
jgi:hypothetical protein